MNEAANAARERDRDRDLVVSLALIFACPALAMLAWNYGAADAYGLPHVAFWPVFWTRLALRLLVR